LLSSLIPCDIARSHRSLFILLFVSLNLVVTIDQYSQKNFSVFFLVEKLLLKRRQCLQRVVVEVFLKSMPETAGLRALFAVNF